MKTIGVAMIVRNEQQMLVRCLESVECADQIVICDTGSEDKTADIAKLFTEHVHQDYKWADHFSEARNHVRRKMTTDWILSIDADERLLTGWDSVRDAVQFAEDRQFDAVNVRLVAANRMQSNAFPRLFRNAEHIHWIGAAHNVISVAGAAEVPVQIEYGYSPAHLKDPDRTMRILEAAVAKEPTSRDMFYLSREYYVRLRLADCVSMLGRYLEQAGYMPEKADAYLMLARAFWSMGQNDDARAACLMAIAINANFKEAIVFMSEMCGPGRGNEKWDKNADQWKRMAETADNYDVLFVRAV